MEVYVEREKQSKNIKFEGTGEELFRKLKINKEEVILVRDGKIITQKQKLSDKDKIRILSVISGG